MSYVKVYSAKKYIITFGEVDLTNEKAKGGYLSITKKGDPLFDSDTDIDGNVTVFSNADNQYEIKYTCPQEANVNNKLSTILVAAQLAGDARLAMRALTVKDPSGTTVYFDQNCLLANFPDSEFEEKPGTRAWPFIATDLDQFIGATLKV